MTWLIHITCRINIRILFLSLQSQHIYVLTLIYLSGVEVYRVPPIFGPVPDIILVTITPALAEIRLVPEEYSTIQAAIDNCNHGDTVIVSPGTYVERINFSGRNIILRSNEPNNPGIVSATIIECPQPEAVRRGQAPENKGSVITFENGETSQAVLTGFTITGGYGTLNNVIEEGIVWGGGIFCVNASPTITQNVITNNNVVMSDQGIAGYGGGIACLESGAIIYRNIIKDNTAYAGAGIMTYLSESVICDNLIYDNCNSWRGRCAARRKPDKQHNHRQQCRHNYCKPGRFSRQCLCR